MSNLLDNLEVDVIQLYQQYPIDEKKVTNQHSNFVLSLLFKKIYGNPLIPIIFRDYCWRLARRTNIDINFIEKFNSYWTSVLGGRPLITIHDLFFFKNLYRLKFSHLNISEYDNAYAHLRVWQSPEAIFQLLNLVSKQWSHNYLEYLRPVFKLKKKIRSLLEFGCGTAPITDSLFQFYPSKSQMKVYIADIQTIGFHYGAYKFRHKFNVKPVLLNPENRFLLQLDDTVDVIFCHAVFEHLNKPFETVKLFHKVLSPGGILSFDYVKGTGHGLDTPQGIQERDQVLNFVSRHFDILTGTISKEESVRATIVRKK